MRGVPFDASVRAWLASHEIQCTPLAPPPTTHHSTTALPSPPTILSVHHNKYALHIRPTPTSTDELLHRDATRDLADAWESAARLKPDEFPTLVHLYEDTYRARTAICQSRLLAMAGRTRRLHARHTTVERIDAATLNAFLAEHHLWGPTQARFRYGLFLEPSRGGGARSPGATERSLVAVASFSARRHVLRGGERYRSHELIRYCSRRGESVAGGISKLIAAFRREMRPDDIATVIDRDWGCGAGWSSLGFEPVQTLPPATFFIAPDGGRCHAAGTGANPYRRQLPAELLAEFAEANGGAAAPYGTSEELVRFLRARGYLDVYDAGARRLLLLLRKPSGAGSDGDAAAASDDDAASARQLWESTQMVSGKAFYAPNRPPGGG